MGFQAVATLLAAGPTAADASPGAAHEPVSLGVTLLFASLLAGLILALALEEKLHAKKSVIAGLAAVVCLLLGAIAGILPFADVVVGSHPASPAILASGENHGGESHGGENHSPEKPNPQKPNPQKSNPEKPSPEKHGSKVHVGGHEIHMPVYIPAIDWGVIAIILGSSLFVDVVSRSGLFTWVAIKVTKASRGDPLWLLASYGAMTVVFSAVLNNVTAMIIVGSLTAVSLEKLGRKDKLLVFLLTEGLLTNVGGMLTLISSVPNIIVGTAAGISFVEFFLKSCAFVTVATVLTIWMGARRGEVRRLTGPAERREAERLVAGFDENDGIESPFFFWFGAVMTVLFIATIATTSVLPYIHDLGMGFVALAFATVMLVRYKSVADKLYQTIDWDLLGFFAALFVVINVMEHAAVLELIGVGLASLIGLGELVGTAALLIAAAVFSSVTDNIPLAAMLAKILVSLGVDGDSPLWWSVIFGANLGGNITPIGSASTLVAVTIMHKHELPMTFGRFVVAAAPFAAIQIVLAVLYVVLFLR